MYILEYVYKACMKSNYDYGWEKEGKIQEFLNTEVTLKIDVSNIFSYLQQSQM